MGFTITCFIKPILSCESRMGWKDGKDGGLSPESGDLSAVGR